MHIEEIQSAIREEHLDGWLFFDHHQRDPLAYRILKLNPKHTATRRWYYFIPAQGDPKGLVHAIESGALSGLPGDVRKYSSWTAQVDGLRALARGLAQDRDAVFAELRDPLCFAGGWRNLELVRGTGVEIATSANLVQLFEARWTAEQLEMHLEAGRRVDRIRAEAFQKIAAALAAGQTITEWDVNRFIRAGFESSGMVTDHGPIVAVNSNMSDPHYEPEADRSREIRKGDAVLIDMWAKLDRPGAVYYDITWTGYLRRQRPLRSPKYLRSCARRPRRAVRCVQSAIGRGELIHGFEVDDAARTYIKDRGFGEYFVHRTGHSIGEEVHGTGANMDNLETHDERRIIDGTCFSVEPGVYLPEFGIRSEVNVYVGAADARVTGEVQQKLVTIQ